jgi:hypothetical protein
VDDEKTEQPWAVEHYGFADEGPGSAGADDPAATAAPSGPQYRARGRGASVLRRGGLAIGGGLLALGLVAGAGGFAVAQAADPGQPVVATGHAHDGPRGRR